MRRIATILGVLIAATLFLTGCSNGPDLKEMKWYATSLGDVMCIDNNSDIDCNFDTLVPSMTKTGENSEQLEVKWVVADGAKVPCFMQSERTNYYNCYWKGAKLPNGVEKPEWMNSSW
jgi:hypothetical protein